MRTPSAGHNEDTPTPQASLASFRHALYGCLGGWADALLKLADAVLRSPGPVGSIPRLSLDVAFRRSHSQPLQSARARRRRR